MTEATFGDRIEALLRTTQCAVSDFDPGNIRDGIQRTGRQYAHFHAEVTNPWPGFCLGEDH
jgi:hypothetical protein